MYISQKHFKYKVTHEMQADSNLLYFFFLLICILMGKGLDKLGEFNVFCASAQKKQCNDLCTYTCFMFVDVL